MPYTDTTLWKTAFLETRNGMAGAATQRLASEYAKSWNTIKRLVARITADLPNLTLHDEAHLNAVWACADLIVGSKYALNPAEVFVLGEAILLHDAGLTTAAYPNGMHGIQQLPQWTDTITALLCEKLGRVPTASEVADPPLPIQNGALFTVLREIHARRAAFLAINSLSAGSESPLFVVDDFELRSHYGELIGRIAASHHWNAQDLSRLGPGLGPIEWMPAEWTIEPIKLACLLRCSDAIQLDRARAPDVTFALLRPDGVSGNHWGGQNR